MRPIRSFVLPLGTLVVLSACGSHDSKDSVPVSMSRNPEPGSAQATMQPGDVRIVTTDNGIDLALLGDTISSGLSEYALSKAKAGTDTAAVKGSGFGASIEKMVKSQVQTAIGTRVAFPLSAVRDIRDDNGTIVFAGEPNPGNLFKGTKVNGKPLLESFSAADAQRFVDAVRARKNAAVQK